MLNRFVFVYLKTLRFFSFLPRAHTATGPTAHSGEDATTGSVTEPLTEPGFNRTGSVKAKKCDFHVSSVRFLGFVVERGQIKTDPVKAVVEWPSPTNRRQLQRYLGFANFYQRSIGDYSKIASPLTKLTSLNIPVVR